MSDEDEAWNIWAIVRRVLFWLVAGTVILGVLLMLLAVLFERRIAEAAVAAIKKQLRTEINVEDYSFSLIRRFPNAVLYLKNVRVGAYGDSSQVARVQTLALKCSIWGAMTGNYQFHTLELHDGELDFYRNDKGLSNFDVLQPSDGSFEPMPINKLQLVNMRLHYRDEQLGQHFALLFNSGEVSHRAADEESGTPAYYQLSADAQTQYFMSGSDSILLGNALGVSATVIERPDSNLYRSEDVRLTLNGSLLRGGGLLFPLRDSVDGRLMGFDVDFSANTQEGKWRSFMPVTHSFCDSLLLPAESNSNLYASLEVQGEWLHGIAPRVVAFVGMKNGKFTHAKIPALIRDVDFEWLYTNRDSVYEEETWDLLNFYARIDGQPINISMTSNGSHNPHLSCRLSGGFSLAAFYEYLHPAATGGSGVVRIDSLRIEGFYSDMLDPTQQNRVQTLGSVAMQSATLAFDKKWLTLEKGKIDLRGNIASIAALELLTDSSQMRLNGNVANLLPYLMRDAENSYDARLIFNLGITSEVLQMNELMRLYAQNEPLDQHEWQQRLQQWQGRIVAQVGDAAWGTHHVQNLHAEASLENAKIDVHKFRAQAAEGAVVAIATVELPKSSSEGLRMEVAARVEQAESARLLQLFDNFYQQQFTDRQISGKLNMTTHAVVQWDSVGAFAADKLSVFADITLQNGELLQPAPLALAAQESRIAELGKVRFVDCYAHLRIQQQALTLPRLYLRSSGYNLTAALRQRFSGDVEAFLKYNSANVLVSRLQSAQPQAEAPTRARTEGIYNLYFHTQGNANTQRASLRLGKTAVKNAMTQSIESWTGNFGGLFSLQLQQLSAQVSRDSALRLPINGLEEPASWGDLPAFGEEQ